MKNEVNGAAKKPSIKLDISQDEMPEFIGQIIDIFEDFLEDEGIDIPNPEKDEDDELNEAIIYGSHYGRLQDDLEALVNNWQKN
jgi:hypothetical protein